MLAWLGMSGQAFSARTYVAAARPPCESAMVAGGSTSASDAGSWAALRIANHGDAADIGAAAATAGEAPDAAGATAPPPYDAALRAPGGSPGSHLCLLAADALQLDVDHQRFAPASAQAILLRLIDGHGLLVF